MEQQTLNQLYNVSEVELVYRYKAPPGNRIKVNSANDAYQVLKVTWDMDRIELLEQFKILLLDYRQNCLGISEISTGGFNQCPIEMKLVYATALKAKASKLIAAHNHPSGELQPSKADIELTHQMKEAGRLFSIRVEDHLILSKYGYYSFADHGYMP